MRQGEDFSPPRGGAKQLYRGAILRRLDAAVEEGIRQFYLVAPGGFGKTVVLSQWLHPRRNGVAWLALDEHDNNEERLAARLLRALAFAQKQNRRLAARLRRIEAPSFQDLREALDLLVRDGPRDWVLVLDDLHRLTDRDRLRDLARTVALLPPSFLVCLAGRTEPDGAFGEGILKGTMRVLPGSLLAFTREEVAELLRLRKGDPRDGDALFARTGGWPIAVEAFLLGPRTGPTAGAPGEELLFPYLQAHVWDLLDEGTRTFLVQVSLAPFLTPELCSRLTGLPRCDGILQDLHRRNLFLSRSEDGTYRFHDLFREFLLLRLEELRRPEEREALCRVLAEALFEGGHYYAAASFYIRCSDGKSVSACCRALRQYAPQHPLEERIAFTKRYLLGGPDPLGKRHPDAAAQCAVAHYLDGDVEGFFSSLDFVLEAARERDDEDFRRLAGILRLLDCRRPLGAYLEELLHLPGSEGNRPGPGTEALPPGTLTAYLPLMHRSFTDRTDRLPGLDTFPDTFCRACRPLLGDDVDLIGLCAQGGGLYEQNRLEEACELAVRAEARAAGCREDLRFCADLLFLTVLTALGRRDEAQRLEGEIARRMGEEDLRALLPNFRAWRYGKRLAEGDREAAAEWLARHAVPVTEKPALHRITQHFVTLRALLAEGSPDLALLLGEKLRKLAEDYRRPLDRLQALILLTLAQWQRGERGRALDLLEEALAAAAPQGLIRGFLDEAPGLRPIFPAFLKSRRGGDEALRRFAVNVHLLVLEACGPSESAHDLEEPAAPLRLSPRQEALLGLLERNATYRDVAEALGVSHSTAKYHVLKLYRTLGVTSAAEALRKARRP